MGLVERPFSEFLRQPKDVVSELAEHDVLLRRQNAPALRLTQADRDEARAEAFGALARLLRNLAVENYSPVAQLLREWKATAEIHADPKLARRFREPIEAAGNRIAAPAG